MFKSNLKFHSNNKTKQFNLNEKKESKTKNKRNFLAPQR